MISKLVVATLTFAIVGSLATLALATHAPPGTKLWAYQAGPAFINAQMAQYDIGTDTFDASCIPDTTANGRGVAAAADGSLWYTRLDGFAGDGFIHNTSTPPGCVAGTSIPFIDGLGGTFQDDVGAIDVDPDDGGIWAAGYAPCAPAGTPCGFFALGATEQFLYKVNTAGTLLQYCHIPFQPPGGNDTLAVATFGLQKVILTDAGEFFSNQLHAVQASTCVGGGLGTIVTTFTLPNGVRGVDYDFTTGTLIGTNDDGTLINDYGPLAAVMAVTATMSSAPVFDLEDVSLSVVGSQQPLPQQGKSTGGGQVGPGKRNFGFNAKVRGGIASGHLTYNIKGGISYKCEVTLITSFVLVGKNDGEMEFEVDCGSNGDHEVRVVDEAEPGKTDKFFFDGVGGTIDHGNIQMHDK